MKTYFSVPGINNESTAIRSGKPQILQRRNEKRWQEIFKGVFQKRKQLEYVMHMTTSASDEDE